MSNKTINLSAIINNNNLNNERNNSMKNENGMLPPPPAEIKLEETNNLPTPKELSTAIIGSLLDELKTVSHNDGGWHNYSTTIHVLNLKSNILNEIVEYWGEAEVPSADFFLNILNEIEKEASFDYDEEIHNEAIRKLENRFWSHLSEDIEKMFS